MIFSPRGKFFWKAGGTSSGQGSPFVSCPLRQIEDHFPPSLRFLQDSARIAVQMNDMADKIQAMTHHPLIGPHDCSAAGNRFQNRWVNTLIPQECDRIFQMNSRQAIESIWCLRGFSSPASQHGQPMHQRNHAVPQKIPSPLFLPGRAPFFPKQGKRVRMSLCARSKSTSAPACSFHLFWVYFNSKGVIFSSENRYPFP